MWKVQTKIVAKIGQGGKLINIAIGDNRLIILIQIHKNFMQGNVFCKELCVSSRSRCRVYM